MTRLSFRKKIKAFYGLTALIVVAGLMCSCVNEDEKMGLSLVTSSSGLDVLNAPNSLATLSTHSFFSGDSLKVSSYGKYVLGSYSDEYFGRVTASVYTSLSMDQSRFDFKALGTVDSVVLCLACESAFTKDTSVKSAQMQISVYEMAAALDSSTAFVTQTVPIENEAIFNGTVTVSPYEGVMLDNDSSIYNPHIRLRLSDKFVQKLSQGVYESNDAFREEFKGVCIKAVSVGSNEMLAYVNMRSAQSGIKIYYHNDTDGSKGKTDINFGGQGWLMHLDYDYSSTPLAQWNTQKDTLDLSDYIYVACLGVSEAKIDIAGLSEWYSLDSIKGSAINRAELILPVASISGPSYHYPKYLSTFRKQDGKFYYTTDQLSGNWSGNRYDKELNAYRIDITSYLQNYLNGAYPTCELYLIPDGRISSAERVILNGPNSSNPPQLNIIYSHPSN